MSLIEIFILVVGAYILFIAVGHLRFRSMATNEIQSLFSHSTLSVGPEQLRSRWENLPDPVRRYFCYSITEHAPAIRVARLKHDGFFRTKPGQGWFNIKGEQYFTAAKPGFVWAASIRMAPLVSIAARDRLLSGRGNMLVKLAGTITLANASGAEIDQGSKLRWLAENVWFPYSFVGEHIEWEPIDSRLARATLRDGGVTVTAVVDVDDNGRLVSIHADRYRDIGGGHAILTPWTGHCSEYQEFSGFRVPTSVEVAWDIGDVLFTYARFRVTKLEYNVFERF